MIWWCKRTKGYKHIEGQISLSYWSKCNLVSSYWWPKQVNQRNHVRDKWRKLDIIAKKEGKAMQQRALKNGREGAYWGLLCMGHQQENYTQFQNSSKLTCIWSSAVPKCWTTGWEKLWKCNRVKRRRYNKEIIFHTCNFFLIYSHTFTVSLVLSIWY